MPMTDEKMAELVLAANPGAVSVHVDRHGAVLTVDGLDREISMEQADTLFRTMFFRN